jgi:PTH1 family peptidyl-tRNA hydrolase
MQGRMKVVVGLGNPGSRYVGTRHNVGFDVADLLARTARFTHRFDADVAEVVEGVHKLLLLKPQTFMNLSGRAVRQAMDFYQLTPGDLLVVCDDIALPLGQLRARGKGTHGGHNGLRDIQNHLGTTEYARLRVGVGAPEGDDAAGFVLDRFRPGERTVVKDALLRATQAVLVWAQQGIDVCMNLYNARAKEK